MRNIWKIFKFVFIDNLRSVWAVVYLLFYATASFSLIHFTGSFTRSAVSIMNIIILIAPLVSSMMSSMYYFNKTDLLHLLLAQPVKRSEAFLGMFMGVAVTQSLAVGLGLTIGFISGYSRIENTSLLLTLVGVGILLSLIFAALSMFVSVTSRDKLKGIGMALFIWLFMAVIYDGLMLMYFIVFSEYPIEEHAIVLSLLNPIDLSRIFIMLHLDVSALMGYSGAVFQDFFGNPIGKVLSAAALLFWVVLPVIGMIIKSERKDF